MKNFKLNPVAKVILIVIIFILFVVSCSKAQEPFTARTAGFCYLRDDSTWSEWSIIKHDIYIYVQPFPFIINIYNDSDDMYVLDHVIRTFHGKDTIDNTRFIARKWIGETRTGDTIYAIHYKFKNNKVAYQFVHKKWQYYFSNK
jgi:hypothetical protein